MFLAIPGSSDRLAPAIHRVYDASFGGILNDRDLFRSKSFKMIRPVMARYHRGNAKSRSATGVVPAVGGGSILVAVLQSKIGVARFPGSSMVEHSAVNFHTNR